MDRVIKEEKAFKKLQVEHSREQEEKRACTFRPNLNLTRANSTFEKSHAPVGRQSSIKSARDNYPQRSLIQYKTPADQ